MRRFLWFAALGLVAAAALAPPANAHARLVHVQRVPGAMRFFFDDEIRAGPGIAAIRNDDGSILAGKPRAAGKVLVVPLRADLPDGGYSVRWRAVSDDGHELGGVVTFAVGAGRSPPAPGLSAGSTGPGAGSIVARWLFFLGLLGAAGVAVFRLVIWRAETREEEPRIGWILLEACFALTLAGALLLLWLSHATFETRFGRVVTAAAIAAGIGVLAAGISTLVRAMRPVALLAGLVLLPVPTLAGHALDAGQSRLDLVVDVAHVTAAAVWLGGLLSLVAIVTRAAGETCRALAHRFSSLALASVALLVATGIWRAVAELSAVSQVWTTGYGRAILVKSVLLAVTVALAVRTRYVLLRGPFARLRLGVAGESAVLLGVVVAVAFLTDLPPGRVASAAAPAPSPPSAPRPPRLPPPDSLVLAKQDGRLAVALAATTTAIEATVLGPSNTGVNGLDVEIGGVRATACGSGCYRAVVPRPRIARVRVGRRTLLFRLPARPRNADGLIRRATRTFRALRAVTYVERLSSGPGSKVVSRWTLEAPNRFSYVIPGGPGGIVIGSKRWDRSTAAGRWRASKIIPPSHQPAPLWAGRITNAHVIANRGRLLVVSLLNRSLPAWFTIRFDRRTLRPAWLEMTAAAHFMRHRYTSFNRPVRIEPPR